MALQPGLGILSEQRHRNVAPHRNRADAARRDLNGAAALNLFRRADAVNLFERAVEIRAAKI